MTTGDRQVSSPAAARDERDEEALRVAAAPAAREGASLRVLSAWVFFENVGSMATMFDGVDRLAADQATATARLVAPVREEFPELTVSEHVVRAGSVSKVLVAATMRRRRDRHRIPCGVRTPLALRWVM